MSATKRYPTIDTIIADDFIVGYIEHCDEFLNAEAPVEREVVLPFEDSKIHDDTDSLRQAKRPIVEDQMYDDNRLLRDLHRFLWEEKIYHDVLERQFVREFSDQIVTKALARKLYHTRFTNEIKLYDDNLKRAFRRDLHEDKLIYDQNVLRKLEKFLEESKLVSLIVSRHIIKEAIDEGIITDDTEVVRNLARPIVEEQLHDDFLHPRILHRYLTEDVLFDHLVSKTIAYEMNTENMLWWSTKEPMLGYFKDFYDAVVHHHEEQRKPIDLVRSPITERKLYLYRSSKDITYTFDESVMYSEESLLAVQRLINEQKLIDDGELPNRVLTRYLHEEKLIDDIVRRTIKIALEEIKLIHKNTDHPRILDRTIQEDKLLHDEISKDFIVALYEQRVMDHIVSRAFKVDVDEITIIDDVESNRSLERLIADYKLYGDILLRSILKIFNETVLTVDDPDERLATFRKVDERKLFLTYVAKDFSRELQDARVLGAEVTRFVTRVFDETKMFALDVLRSYNKVVDEQIVTNGQARKLYHTRISNETKLYDDNVSRDYTKPVNKQVLFSDEDFIRSVTRFVNDTQLFDDSTTRELTKKAIEESKLYDNILTREQTRTQTESKLYDDIYQRDVYRSLQKKVMQHNTVSKHFVADLMDSKLIDSKQVNATFVKFLNEQKLFENIVVRDFLRSISETQLIDDNTAKDFTFAAQIETKLYHSASEPVKSIIKAVQDSKVFEENVARELTRFVTEQLTIHSIASKRYHTRISNETKLYDDVVSKNYAISPIIDQKVFDEIVRKGTTRIINDQKLVAMSIMRSLHKKIEEQKLQEDRIKKTLQKYITEHKLESVCTTAAKTGIDREGFERDKDRLMCFSYQWLEQDYGKEILQIVNQMTLEYNNIAKPPEAFTVDTVEYIKVAERSYYGYILTGAPGQLYGNEGDKITKDAPIGFITDDNGVELPIMQTTLYNNEDVMFVDIDNKYDETKDPTLEGTLPFTDGNTYTYYTHKREPVCTTSTVYGDKTYPPYRNALPEEHKVEPIGMDGDKFGSVALSKDGKRMVIGAATALNQQGKCIQYDWNGTEWLATTSIQPQVDPGQPEWFGHSVALSEDGNTLAVGASSYDISETQQDVGRIYIFDYIDNVWTEREQIIPQDSIDDNTKQFKLFGSAVALSGDGLVLAVGASGDSENIANGGTVYIYNYDGIRWNQVSYFGPGDAGAEDGSFGSSVALSMGGLLMAVGAPYAITETYGKAYVYDISTSTPIELDVITAPDPANPGLFGSAVALNTDGSILAIGAEASDVTATNMGIVHLYDNISSVWTPRTTLQASDGVTEDYFGHGVALSGTGREVVVGAWYDDNTIGTDIGSVYVFGYPDEPNDMRESSSVCEFGTPFDPKKYYRDRQSIMNESYRWMEEYFAHDLLDILNRISPFERVYKIDECSVPGTETQECYIRNRPTGSDVYVGESPMYKTGEERTCEEFEQLGAAADPDFVLPPPEEPGGGDTGTGDGGGGTEPPPEEPPPEEPPPENLTPLVDTGGEAVTTVDENGEVTPLYTDTTGQVVGPDGLPRSPDGLTQLSDTNGDPVTTAEGVTLFTEDSTGNIVDGNGNAAVPDPGVTL